MGVCFLFVCAYVMDELSQLFFSLFKNFFHHELIVYHHYSLSFLILLFFSLRIFFVSKSGYSYSLEFNENYFVFFLLFALLLLLQFHLPFTLFQHFATCLISSFGGLWLGPGSGLSVCLVGLNLGLWRFFFRHWNALFNL